MRKYIKFYGLKDFATYWAIPQVEEKIVEISKNGLQKSTVQNILEWENIVNYLESEIELENLDTNARTEMIQFLRKQISIFFYSLNSTNIISNIKDVPNEYIDDFIQLFGYYKLAKKFDEKAMEVVLKESSLSTYNLLKNKYFVEEYPKLMKDRILSDTSSIEILLTQVSDSNTILFFTPNNISNLEWESLIIKYIKSDNANLNYLRLLRNNITIPNFHFLVTAEIKFNAQKRCHEIEEELLSKKSENAQEFMISVFSNKEEYQKALRKSSSLDYIGLVDENEITNNPRLENIANYLKYKLGLFKTDLLCTLPRQLNTDLGIFEKFLSIKTAKTYIIGSKFITREYFLKSKLRVFKNIIENELNLSLEDIISWSFNKMMIEKYGVRFLPIDFLSKNETISNRNAKIFSVEENIRKQYSLLYTKNIIEQDLYNEVTLPKIASLASKIEKKYVYLNKEFRKIQQLLFSEQSSISSIDKYKQGGNFVELLLDSKLELKINDFKVEQQKIINQLVEQEFLIEEDSTMILKFKNLDELNVLLKLYAQDVISYYHEGSLMQEAIDSLLIRGVLFSENTLFSKPDVEYMNFVLNTGYWDDGYGLRNNYQHGGRYYEDEEKYNDEYLLGMIILIIYTVRIEEELALEKIILG